MILNVETLSQLAKVAVKASVEAMTKAANRPLKVQFTS